MFSEKILKCRECGEDFVFSAGEQEFYAEKGLKNEPARCPACRASYRNNGSGSKTGRRLYSAVCARCGMVTQVPFEPNGSKPVYCRECFQRSRVGRY